MFFQVIIKCVKSINQIEVCSIVVKGKGEKEKRKTDLHLNPVNTEQKYPDRDLYHETEDVSVYTGHSLYNTTQRITMCLLISHCFITIHLISGLKSSTLRSRLSVYIRQNFSTQIAI